MAFITLGTVIGFLLVATMMLINTNRRMDAAVAERTRNVVETAHSVVATLAAQERAGALTRAQAQAEAIRILKGTRYGDNEYLWVNDMQPRMVMHPTKPEMDGQELAGVVDADGVHPFTAMTEAVRRDGQGTIEYRWPKPGSDQPQPKISYVKGFAPWGWVIGSGVYVDDIRAALWREAVTLLSLMAIVLVAVGLLNRFLARSISRPVTALADRMRALVEGDTASEIPGTHRGDEVGRMAQAVEVFRENDIAKRAADAARAKAQAEQKMVVETVSSHLSSLSDGNLTASIAVEFPGDYATLKGNFNDALANLRGLISQVSESTAAIRTGSGEIAQASEDLARRTETNAASLEETSASLVQIDGRLKATALAASRTVERADQAITTVGGGRAIADEAVQAMGRVSESAKGIDSVIEGLDKIAFQTRVLAMNAAVEAGRAGDAGRGFAVVADLVSALAMRAEEEAKRARDQLTVTQSDIVTAVDAVRKVDGALADISDDVGQVHELLGTMASDNRAQSAAISEISSTIGAMDQSTQKNAAMVEETSAAARNLAVEVGSLADQAGRFVVDGGGARAARRLPASLTVPAKPLLAAALPALVRTEDDDWQAF
ncbi:cache domain-containing protein [Sphingomonas sp. ac-8]|uniref:cache domain-containing protein n=1 Tax=Sphingomonas sp. ac-8 TaxID=3242977 RepID=UPI003A808EE9